MITSYFPAIFVPLFGIFFPAIAIISFLIWIESAE